MIFEGDVVNHKETVGNEIHNVIMSLVTNAEAGGEYLACKGIEIEMIINTHDVVNDEEVTLVKNQTEQLVNMNDILEVVNYKLEWTTELETNFPGKMCLVQL